MATKEAPKPKPIINMGILSIEFITCSGVAEKEKNANIRKNIILILKIVINNPKIASAILMTAAK